MTDIQTLALRTAERLGITNEAAEAALENCICQIEASQYRDIDRDNIKFFTASFLMESVEMAHQAGDLGQRELAALGEIMPKVQEAKDTLVMMEQQRNTAIKAALNAGARVKDVAAGTGLSRQRVEQIRDL